MKPVQDHYADVLALARPLPTETVDLNRARGLTLAQEVRAKLAIPPFTNSAMDGFAVRAADVVVGKPIPVVGDIGAGSQSLATLPPGVAVRIMTGGMIPIGADCVLQVEFTEDAETMMRPEAPVEIIPTREITAGTHVRCRGEDVAEGESVFFPGTVLTSAHISALFALGHSEVRVHRRPRVGVITTGAELSMPGAPLGEGQIPDSNRPLVTNLIEERGGVAIGHTLRSDVVGDFLGDFAALVAETDMVVTTGGVSAGAYDVVKAALRPRGIDFGAVAMQPGKPQGYGTVVSSGGRSVPIICLPGNPVSVFVSMQLFALPLMDILLGRHVCEFAERFMQESVGLGWHKKPGRVQFMPCCRNVAGKIVPASSGGSGSHLIGSLPQAKGLAQVAADIVKVEVGESIPVLWIGNDHGF